MDWFNFVKRHYDEGRYTKNDAIVFMIAHKITPEQFEDIIGEPHS